MKKFKHIVLGIKLGIAIMILVLCDFVYYGVSEHYSYGHKNGMISGKSDVMIKLDPYIDVVSRSHDKPFACITAKADGICLVKNNDQYVVKRY